MVLFFDAQKKENPMCALSCITAIKLRLPRSLVLQ